MSYLTHDQDGSLGSIEAARFPKRRKVAIACHECRSRKIKCDGKRPVCGPCSYRSRGHACGWDTPKARQSPSSKYYIRDLENRLRNLEQDHWSQKNSAQSPGSGYLPRQPSAVRENDTIGSLIAQSRVHQAVLPQSSPETPFEVGSAMIGNIEDDSGNRGFFGTSSAGSFMKQVNAAIKSQNTSPITAAEEKTQLPSLTPKDIGIKVKAVDHILPSRRTADRLMGIYWLLPHSLNPLLHQAETEVIYQKFWTGEGEDSNLDFCLINLIFATACQLDENTNPEDRQALAHVYYLRARQAIYGDFWEGSSIQSVQCLLLMGQYLQTTNDAHRCWMSIGMAVRLAQGLGLHSEELMLNLQSKRDQELVKKVWTGCVFMDRIVCMILGRPGMISRTGAISLPPPEPVAEERLMDEEVLTHQMQTPPVSRITFYATSLRLAELTNEVLLAFYNPDTKIKENGPFDLFFGGPLLQAHGRSQNNVYQLNNATVFQLDASLNSWKQSLPGYLKFGSETSRSSILHLQAQVLQVRYLHVRVLLFRPVLSALLKALDPSQNCKKTSLVEKVALECSITCIETAQELIDMIYRQLPEDPSKNALLFGWWYVILYSHTSATLLVAARLLLQFQVPAILGEKVSQDTINKHWLEALAILKFYRGHHPVAQRCETVLGLMWNKLPERFEVLQKQEHQQPSKAAGADFGSDAQERFNNAFSTVNSSSDGRKGGALERCRSEYVLPPLTNSATGETQTPLAQLETDPAASVSQPNTGYEFGNISGLNDGLLANFDDWDIGDMSWLNSLPCQL